MKKIIILIISLIFFNNIFSQDIIIKKNGDEIKSKVIEVGTIEIKFKNFDNLTGPTYSILKAEVFVIKYENGTKDVFTQNETTQINTNTKSKIYFIRNTGFAGSASAFKAFIDDKFTCKLHNKKYSVYEIVPGKHYFSIQFSGKTSKESTEKLELLTEAGKIYYLQILFTSGLFINTIKFIYIKIKHII